MKKVIKNGLAMVVMLTTMFSYANEFVGADLLKDDITNVTFENVTEGSVLTIKDLNGLVLYKETILEQGVYSKEFDLTALPDGDYIFEMDKEFEIKIIPFKVKMNKVHFKKELQSVTFKPSVVIEKGLVKIQKSMPDKSPLQIKVFYENGDLVYTEKVENKFVFNKTLDFSSSLKGEYRIVMSTPSRIFENRINL
ncbi:hypothetical protein EGM88_04235 [Aureibaculum marinum]|uniref:T9SS C-terminal target domain-containing protein n=1 Tax=Aureibaculum marinum TaxID=2487930 RepID=A0A3N4P271_9FLAO|nr:hypothetical protein [Aureibaculum marinum]RPD99066.1 hypothetical protein EGM88_04235 [Aureibaculum marinum]